MQFYNRFQKLTEYKGTKDSGEFHFDKDGNLKKFVAMRYQESQAAKALHTSQSRVAKIENGDSSVSIELLIKGLLGLGASRKVIGSALF